MMATVFNVVCDVHDRKGEQVNADHEGVPIQLGKAQFEADLCQECLDLYSGLLQPLVDVARKPGKISPPQRRSPGSSGGSGSAGSSKREEPNSPDGTYTCRAPHHVKGIECDRDVSTPQQPGWPNAQGRGMHERRAHNFNMPRLREWAKQQGKDIDTTQITIDEMIEAAQ